MTLVKKEIFLIISLIFFFENKSYDILSLRLKGLKQELTKKELIAVLYWYLANRGFKYELISEQKENDDLDIDIKNKLPVEVQRDFFEKYGYFKGTLNRKFANKDYLKEIELIFKISGDKYNIKNEFLKLFKRQRSFEEGPGNLESFKKIKKQEALNEIIKSPFNRFKLNEQNELDAYDTMWDKSTGRCIYDNEYRAPKHALTSSIFNLLNDLNNIRINNQRLTKEDKIEALKIAFLNQTNTNEILKYLSKKYDFPKDEITGLRIDKKNKKLLTPLEGLHKIKTIVRKENKNFTFDFANFYDENLNPLQAELIDQWIYLFSKTKIVSKRREIVQKIIKKLGWEVSDQIQENLANNLPSFNETHAFSLNFMKQKMIPELLNQQLNQMEVIYANKLKPWNYQENSPKRKYLDLKWLDDENFIASPTTKRAIRQTFKVLNRIIKLHCQDYKIENIVVEMARDLNVKAEKERIKALQKLIEARNKSLKSQIDAIEEKLGIKIRGQAFLKLWLYEQQCGKDAYTNKALDKDRVILDPSYTDIDHIIPQSQSFIDGMHNKVLTLSKNNADKGQKTPYQYFNDEAFFNKMCREWSNWYLPPNSNSEKTKESRQEFYSKKKFAFLSSRLDYSKPENALGFIERNLVDTRYATKEVINRLQEFVKNVDDTHLMHSTKIKTVNGKMTSFIRKMVESPQYHGPLKRPEGIVDGSINPKTKIKERIYNGHHAEDATFIIHAALKNRQLNKLIEKILSYSNLTFEQKQKHIEDNLFEQWDQNMLDFKAIGKELDQKMANTKFSYMLNKRKNTPLSKETIYGAKYQLDKKGKMQMHKVEHLKLSDLNGNKQKLKEIFDPTSDYKYQIAMKIYDPLTWKALVSLYQNGDAQKPFKLDQSGALIINKRRIKALKIIKEIKDPIEVIPHQIKTKDNILSFKEGLNWFYLNLYKNKKNKNILIPINALNSKIEKGNLVINKEIINNQKQETGINITSKAIKLHYGSIIQDSENGHLYRVVGHLAKAAKLELKPIHYISGKQKHYTINTKIKKWKLLEIDELGNLMTQRFIF